MIFGLQTECWDSFEDIQKEPLQSFKIQETDGAIVSFVCI